MIDIEAALRSNGYETNETSIISPDVKRYCGYYLTVNGKRRYVPARKLGLKLNSIIAKATESDIKSISGDILRRIDNGEFAVISVDMSDAESVQHASRELEDALNQAALNMVNANDADDGIATTHSDAGDDTVNQNDADVNKMSDVMWASDDSDITPGAVVSDPIVKSAKDDAGDKPTLTTYEAREMAEHMLGGELCVEVVSRKTYLKQAEHLSSALTPIISMLRDIGVVTMPNGSSIDLASCIDEHSYDPLLDRYRSCRSVIDANGGDVSRFSLDYDSAFLIIRHEVDDDTASFDEALMLGLTGKDGKRVGKDTVHVDGDSDGMSVSVGNVTLELGGDETASEYSYRRFDLTEDGCAELADAISKSTGIDIAIKPVEASAVNVIRRIRKSVSDYLVGARDDLRKGMWVAMGGLALSGMFALLGYSILPYSVPAFVTIMLLVKMLSLLVAPYTDMRDIIESVNGSFSKGRERVMAFGRNIMMAKWSVMSSRLAIAACGIALIVSSAITALAVVSSIW